MTSLLFPTDFSMASLNAYRYALQMAENFNAAITTLHVYDVPVIMPADDKEYLFESSKYKAIEELGYYRDGILKLKKIAEDINLKKIDTRHLFAFGEVEKEITEVAEKEDAAIIVMGTEGAGEITSKLFGTVTEKIMNSSKVPVLAIPYSYDYKPIRKILLLTKYAKMEMQKLEGICRMAARLKANVEVLEVKQKHNDDDYNIISKWKEHFKKQPVTFHLMSDHTAEEVIVEFTEKHNINLMAIQVHHKKFFERLLSYSLSMELVYYSKLPLLSIPVELTIV